MSKKRKTSYPLKQELRALPLSEVAKQRLRGYQTDTTSPMPLVNRHKNTTVLDLSMGSGLFSLNVKAMEGHTLICNEPHRLYQVIQHAVIENDSVILTPEDIETLRFGYEGMCNTGAFWPLVQKMTLPPQVALVLDLMHFNVSRFECAKKRYLTKTLMWQLFHHYVNLQPDVTPSHIPYAEVVDASTGWYSDMRNFRHPESYSLEEQALLLDAVYDVVEKKRQQINGGIFQPKSTIICKQDDPFTLAKNTDADIAYIDLRYSGTLNYETQNWLFENSLFYHELDPTTEGFLTEKQVVENILALVDQCRHISKVLVAYGNRIGSVPILPQELSRVALGSVVTTKTRTYRHQSPLSLDPFNQEYLFVIENPKKLKRVV